MNDDLEAAAEFAKQIFERASVATGNSVSELAGMAVGVFASMLFHMMQSDGREIITVGRIRDGQIEIEVNVPMRSFNREDAPAVIIVEPESAKEDQ
jgi:hypothetical protein